eukprot:scaffold4559_cov50-Attheya_sp.AAC.5
MDKTWHASAFTGQKRPGTAVWCNVAPRCPFFWLFNHKVTEKACKSTQRGDYCWVGYDVASGTERL